MNSKWKWTVLGFLPFIAAIVSMQSCGGEGGPLGGDGGGGLPSITQQFLDLMSPEQRTASAIGSEKCADCHGGRGDDGEPVYHTWLETKHGERGVGCERCHGPGSVHEDNPTKTNILTFPKTMSAVICAQCHGNIFDQWSTSKHSQLVASPINSVIGNPAQGRTSQCTSCHSGLFRTQVNEEGGGPANFSDAQIREIAQNTVDVVPHSSLCATCHDPHRNTGKLTDDGKEVQLRKSVFNTDTSPVAPGSTANSFINFDHVCAQCHNGRGTNPSDSALGSGTSRPSMHDSNQYNMLMGFGGVEGDGPVDRNSAHATAPGQCSHCHMPGSRHTATVGFDQGCVPCHTAADAAARTAVVKNEIINGLYALRTKMEDWAIATYQSNPNYLTVNAALIQHLWNYSSLINEEATELGVPNTGIPTNHQSAMPIQVKRARHNYFFILRDGGYGPHNAPYARHLLIVANENMDELLVGVTGRAPRSRPNLSIRQKMAILNADKENASRADIRELNGE